LYWSIMVAERVCNCWLWLRKSNSASSSSVELSCRLSRLLFDRVDAAFDSVDARFDRADISKALRKLVKYRTEAMFIRFILDPHLEATSRAR